MLADLTEVRKSPIDGRGIFATSAIPKRRKIGELSGEIVSIGEARRRSGNKRRVAIWEFDEYDNKAMLLENSIGRFVNHSCTPNAFIRVIGYHVELYAKRAIRKGEEVTIDYGPYTHHNGDLRCRCGCSNRYL